MYNAHLSNIWTSLQSSHSLRGLLHQWISLTPFLISGMVRWLTATTNSEIQNLMHSNFLIGSLPLYVVRRIKEEHGSNLLVTVPLCYRD